MTSPDKRERLRRLAETGDQNALSELQRLNARTQPKAQEGAETPEHDIVNDLMGLTRNVSLSSSSTTLAELFQNHPNLRNLEIPQVVRDNLSEAYGPEVLTTIQGLADDLESKNYPAAEQKLIALRSKGLPVGRALITRFYREVQERLDILPGLQSLNSTIQEAENDEATQAHQRRLEIDYYFETKSILREPLVAKHLQAFQTEEIHDQRYANELQQLINIIESEADNENDATAQEAKELLLEYSKLLVQSVEEDFSVFLGDNEDTEPRVELAKHLQDCANRLMSIDNLDSEIIASARQSLEDLKEKLKSQDSPTLEQAKKLRSQIITTSLVRDFNESRIRGNESAIRALLHLYNQSPEDLPITKNLILFAEFSTLVHTALESIRERGNDQYAHPILNDVTSKIEQLLDPETAITTQEITELKTEIAKINSGLIEEVPSLEATINSLAAEIETVYMNNPESLKELQTKLASTLNKLRTALPKYNDLYSTDFIQGHTEAINSIFDRFVKLITGEKSLFFQEEYDEFLEEQLTIFQNLLKNLKISDFKDRENSYYQDLQDALTEMEEANQE